MLTKKTREKTSKFNRDAHFSTNPNQYSIEAIQIQNSSFVLCKWIECDVLMDCSGCQRVFRQLIAKDKIKRFKEPKKDKYNL